MKDSQLYKDTTERVRNACGAGVKMTHLVRETGVNSFRLGSIASQGKKSYKFEANISEDECHAINKALDAIKEAF